MRNIQGETYYHYYWCESILALDLQSTKRDQIVLHFKRFDLSQCLIDLELKRI